MGMRDDLLEMKKEVNEMKEQSFAYELLCDQRKQNKRLFIIWICTFFAFLGLLGYTIWLLNDTYVETTEMTQEITDIDTIENSTIQNGGGN